MPSETRISFLFQNEFGKMPQFPCIEVGHHPTQYSIPLRTVMITLKPRTDDTFVIRLHAYRPDE